MSCNLLARTNIRSTIFPFQLLARRVKLSKTAPAISNGSLLESSRASYSTDKYNLVEVGEPNTDNYRAFFRNETCNQLVSPFHDIPLYRDKSAQVFNMVVEIPRWTNAKMEINKKELMNPLRQDVKKNKLRFVTHNFPYYGYVWNYGALPQTWEDPSRLDQLTGHRGDNDPIDVCEIGSFTQPRGAVIGVKVLGALGLIDEGETDWKVLAIDESDPMASELSTIGDVEVKCPEILKATLDWFRIYKIPTGKPENKFAFDGKYLDRDETIRVIEHAHNAWLGLFKMDSSNLPDEVKKNVKDISLANTTLQNRVTSEQAENVLRAKPAATTTVTSEKEAERVYYINRSKL